MSQINEDLWVTFPGDPPTYVRVAAIDLVKQVRTADTVGGWPDSTLLIVAGEKVWIGATAAEVLTKLTDAVVIASGL